MGLSVLWGAVVDGVDDPESGSFKFGGVVVAEVAFNGGETPAQTVLIQGAGDPAREVAAR